MQAAAPLPLCYAQFWLCRHYVLILILGMLETLGKSVSIAGQQAKQPPSMLIESNNCRAASSPDFRRSCQNLKRAIFKMKFRLPSTFDLFQKRVTQN